YQNGNQSTSANQIQLGLQLTNTSSNPISLNDITIRYWYTADSQQQQQQEIACDYATVDCKNVQYKLVPMGQARSGADTYLEVSFTGGTVAAGANTEIKLRMYKSDWSNYDQSNDYSFVSG